MVMKAQSLYKSWEIRRMLLDASAPALDPIVRKEQCELLQALLKKHKSSAVAAKQARFPATEPSAVPKKRFLMNLTRPLTFLREKLDWQAQQRLEPVIQDIARINPQFDINAQRTQQNLAALPEPVAPLTRPAPRPRGALMTVLRADLGLVLRQAVKQAVDRAPELLFTEIGKVPGEIPRLAGGYVRSMWQVLSHSDPRDTVDYMVEELEEHNTEARAASASSSGERLSVDAGGNARLFVDRRAILIHHSVGAHADGHERDVAASAHRVLHPVPTVRKTPGEPLPLLDTLWSDLCSGDAGRTIDMYGQNIIEHNGQALDDYAARLDHRLFVSDDVVKTFYVNIVYISKALRLLRQHGVGSRGAGGSERDWISGAEADCREQLHEQIAEILNDPALREKALHHFRLELADGSTAVRYTAIAMVGRLGTLDDIGLLLDLVSLLPHGPGNRQESRMLLAAARRLAGIE